VRPARRPVQVGQFCIDLKLAALPQRNQQGLFFRGAEPLPFGDAIRARAKPSTTSSPAKSRWTCAAPEHRFQVSRADARQKKTAAAVFIQITRMPSLLSPHETRYRRP
jgi:hypothetical protein